MQHAIETGKSYAGEAKLTTIRKEIAFDIGMDVDISIIKKEKLLTIHYIYQ